MAFSAIICACDLNARASCIVRLPKHLTSQTAPRACPFLVGHTGAAPRRAVRPSAAPAVRRARTLPTPGPRPARRGRAAAPGLAVERPAKCAASEAVAAAATTAAAAVLAAAAATASAESSAAGAASAEGAAFAGAAGATSAGAAPAGATAAAACLAEKHCDAGVRRVSGARARTVRARGGRKCGGGSARGLGVGDDDGASVGGVRACMRVCVQVYVYKDVFVYVSARITRDAALACTESNRWCTGDMCECGCAWARACTESFRRSGPSLAKYLHEARSAVGRHAKTSRGRW